MNPQNRVAFLPFVRVCLKTKIPKGYPENPSTLGEHLLRRRMELGLQQKDVGPFLSVDDSTVLNWEKGKTVPATRYLPRIVSFLGYDPFPAPRTLGERVVAARRKIGIPRKQLARRLGVDEGALKRWEEERAKPQGRCLAKLARFLADAGSAPGTKRSP